MPVLSEQITSQQPSVSTEGRLRIMARLSDIFFTPMASTMVTVAGKPSGMAATAMATAAQWGFNAALLASPITWILAVIIAVIVAIYLVVAAINRLTGSSISATGIIVGALASAAAFVWNLFLGILDIALAIINNLYSSGLGRISFNVSILL